MFKHCCIDLFLFKKTKGAKGPFQNLEHTFVEAFGRGLARLGNSAGLTCVNKGMDLGKRSLQLNDFSMIPGEGTPKSVEAGANLNKTCLSVLFNCPPFRAVVWMFLLSVYFQPWKQPRG